MMFCKNCGAQLEDSVTFCTQCGIRLTKPVPVTESVPMTEPVPAAEAVPVSETEAKPSSVGEFTESYSAPPMSETVLPPPVEFAAGNSVKEKTFFGVGALVFCLVIIGALSVATGVFAGLYFSAIA